MKKFIKWCLMILMAVLIILISLSIWQMNSNKVAEPSFKTIQSEGNISIRMYESMTVAEVAVSGDRYAAIKSGFTLLANYIFGGNKANTKIAMTAPVIQSENHHNWIIKFVMPANDNINTLPQPDNQQIKLITLPKASYVVIRFSGMNSDSNLNHYLTKLIDYIKMHDLETTGNPIYAFYNPPWILPFLRRNEIMFELKSYP